MTRDGTEKYGAVLHRASHRPDSVHRPGHRHNTVARDPTIGGPDAHDATKGRRPSHRASGIRAQRTGTQATGHGNARTAAGATCRVFCIPRVTRCAIRVVDSSADGELAQVQLAQQHSARVVKTLYYGRVFSGDVIGQNLRSCGGQHPLGVNYVLDGQWNAVQRAPVAAPADLAFSLFCLIHGFVGQHGDKRSKPFVQGIDAVQIRPRHIYGGDFFLADEAAKLRNASVVKIIAAHADLLLPRQIWDEVPPGQATLRESPPIPAKPL